MEAIFPSACVHCGSEGSVFCDTCLLETPRLGGRVCAFCSADCNGVVCKKCYANPPHLDGIIAPFRMAYPIKSAIHAFKYRDLRHLGGFLASQLVNKLQQTTIRIDAVSTVPLHGRRLRERGYNQSEILAKKVAKKISAPYLSLLKRVRYTVPQINLNRLERQESVKDVFKITAEAVRANTVVLVDDVATTTSTLNDAARELKKAGAEKVYGLVVARETSG